MESVFLLSATLSSTASTKTLPEGRKQTQDAKASEDGTGMGKCCADARARRGVIVEYHGSCNYCKQNLEDIITVATLYGTIV